MKITKAYETVPIGKLVPYARNAREHDAKQVAQIRASFREFGTINPCIVDGDYTQKWKHRQQKSPLCTSD